LFIAGQINCRAGLVILPLMTLCAALADRKRFDHDYVGDGVWWDRRIRRDRRPSISALLRTTSFTDFDGATLASDL
jgi:hypothetical protein